MKTATLGELAELVDGRVLGNAEICVSRVAPIDAAQKEVPGQYPPKIKPIPIITPPPKVDQR